MTRWLPAILAAALLSFPPAAAQSPAAGVPVRQNGLVATWYPPASGKPAPAVLVLGGSECGEKGGQYLAQAVAGLGYGALALAYCGIEGLPPDVHDLPLEYFSKAVDWLAAQPLADNNRIGLYGVSIGGETALVVASRDPRITAVIAGVPSSVVWQGFDRRNYASVTPTYTLGGKPVPYLPYDMSKPFISVFDLYQRSLANLAAHQDAIIAVERINGPVLLISGKADTLWPSSAMADQVMQRLDADGFRFPHAHIAYADAGHGCATPPGGGPWLAQLDMLGGTANGNAAARVDMWKRTTAFLAKYLGDP